MSLEQYNAIGVGKLPGHLGIVIVEIGERRLRGEIEIRPHHLAPNGYLHAGTVVTLADTCAGYACRGQLPPTATGFTTIELKSNHLGTALEGTISALATAGISAATRMSGTRWLPTSKAGGRWPCSAARRWSFMASRPARRR